MSKQMRVSVFGGREITEDIYDETVLLGGMLDKEGYTIFCGGGSGVIKNIPDNTKVMGYPARDIRSFLKNNS